MRVVAWIGVWGVVGSLSAQAQEGPRSFGVAVGPSSQDYAAALDDAVRVGSRVYELPQQWREHEAGGGEALLDSLVGLLRERELQVVLSLNPLDTTHDQVPDDLRGRPFDDPVVVRRYLAFVDAVLRVTKDLPLVGVAVGNEVDVLLANDDARWRAYVELVAAARAHVRRARPGVPVGAKVTYDGFRRQRAHVDALVAKSDRLMLTYYPVDADRVRDPRVVGAELAELVAAYPGTPVQLNEVGYPSSAALGSSPARQAAFVDAVFAAWRAHRAIELLNVVWLNDMTPAAVAALEAAHGPDQPLVAFLSSLGVRAHDGTPKPAFERLRLHAGR